MQEGLVLLSSEGTVLSINPTAKRLFDAQDNCIGRNFLMIDRSSGMRTAVNDALDKGRGHTRKRCNGREYQCDLSRIQSDGAVIGAVILAFDITERLNSEQPRREFSANVSHELKTPLQGIIGSAELMENGLVKPEDTPRFVGHIRKEAARLVSLIEDIIRLSQLDEGVELPRESVDLRQVAEDVLDTLQDAAGNAGVSLTVTGQGTVMGVHRLLDEVICNLCENAIKYNRPGGTVAVEIGETKQETTLRVRDTGIGIPPEHHQRIFERFYRVDKSHSRASGGTGLGLSIVKHAVQFHNGTIALQSQPGVGTEITVTFPKD
jgi:two-component system phosphate regulon sensor histidine kinase PhoR